MHEIPPHVEGSRSLFDIGPEVELDPPRVVVAIEDRELRRRVVFVLRADGYDVLPFHTRAALVRHLQSSAVWTGQRRPPDLVLFADDGASPIGPQVAGALERYEMPIPVIVVAASRGEAESPAVQRLGAAAVFARPFDLDDLRTAVANISPAAAP